MRIAQILLMNIAVLGAGAWGTAVALQLAKQHQVALWARNADAAQTMQRTRTNARYLPDFTLPQNLTIHAGVASTQDVANCDLVLVASPVAGLRSQLALLAGFKRPVAWLCKGFEAVQAQAQYGLMPHEVVAQVAPNLQAGVLSGPSFAQEVAQGQPTALVIASPHQTVRDVVVSALHSSTMRVYNSEDWIGVSVGGSVKNVIAIATGVLDGLAQQANTNTHTTDAQTHAAPGLNARAALLTRGLAEMVRFGMALGAEAATFMGLSGMGDLVLTATGDLSRNRRVGLLLAQGYTAQQAVETLGHVAEGVYCARTVLSRAQMLGVDMPITQHVVNLLDGVVDAPTALRNLMQREARTENDFSGTI